MVISTQSGSGRYICELRYFTTAATTPLQKRLNYSVMLGLLGQTPAIRMLLRTCIV